MKPPRRRRSSGPPRPARRTYQVHTLGVGIRERWLSAACGLALVWLAGILLSQPAFRVAQITVLYGGPSAETALTKAHQVSHVVAYNIFLLNSRRLGEEIARVPSVKRAKVLPQLPDRVAVELNERQPIALWRTQAETFLVDDDGQVIAEAGERSLPLVITDVSGRSLVPGDRVERRVLLVAGELQRVLPSLGAAPREIEYNWAGLTVVTDGGWRVLFGDLEHLNRKLQYLAAITALAQRQNLRLALVDLRPKDRPYYQAQS